MHMDNRTRIPFSILRPRKGFGSSWWVALLFALLPTFSWGQQITRLEYFFDTDPGFGNGTPVQVTPAPVLDNFNFSANISALSDGFHTLYIRARDDSSRWGHTLQRPFYKLTVSPPTYGIDLLEYFFNSDPGPGNGTPIQVTPTSELDPFSIALDITSLPDGFNALYFRARNQGGSWSIPLSRIFYKLTIQPSPRTLSSYEYFFNTDPGHGQGTPVPVTVSGAVDSTSFMVDISSFQDGFHSIYVRGRDNTGAWSHLQSRTFFKFSLPPAALPLVDLEYFIDTDPGLNNGNKIAITPTTDLNNFSVAIDVSQLTQGFHKLGFRFRNSASVWSHTNLIPFYRVALDSLTPDIVRMEYFFNQDPGYGQATPIAFTPDDNLSINLNIDISALNNGFNFLFIRTLDGTGKWSHNQMRAFYKEARQDTLLPIVYAEYFIDQDPGFNNGITIPVASDSAYQDLVFSIDIDSLSEGFHKLFLRTRDAKGKWSMTTFQPFFKQIFRDTLGKIVAVEYFYDTDPGAGNGISVPLTPQANVPFLAWSLNLSGINFGQHNLFIRAKDEFGTWSLTNRKEIFYYLDSLPTASLSGPTGVCIHDTGYFEVTLTGTGPWTIAFNNGFRVDTITNITVTPHFIPVVPDSSGFFTAQVLMVQDVYYTGLYTGIPIEYQVFPLPVAAGEISGPRDICEGSTTVGFSVYYIGNAQSYEWTVPAGAVITSSGYYWNYAYIYVDFPPGASSGQVSVRGVNHCGYGPASYLNITMRPHPVVDAGPDQYIPWGDSAVLMAIPSGGNPPYSYYWSPWWVFDNYTLQSPTAWPGSTLGVSVTVSDTFGCSATDGLTIYVGNPNGTTFSGHVRYDNAASSPLANALVMMKQGQDVVFDTLTALDGSYQFAEVPAGYYDLTASTMQAWEAVNATDALLIAKHFVDSVTLHGLKLTAADVNASGYINAIDALQCMKRFVGLIDSFPSGDWYFQNLWVYSNPSGFQSHEIRGILFGDVDASYSPAKSAPGVQLSRHGKLAVPTEGSIELPLNTEEPLTLGAMSLVLQIPAGVEVQSVRLPDGWKGDLVFNREGELLKVAWFSLEPLQLSAGSAVLLINVRYDYLSKANWRVGDGSSLADASGQPLTRVMLYFPELIPGEHGFALGENYPNPFRGETSIPYVLPADAKVRLTVLNLLGEEVLEVFNGQQPAGEHVSHLNAARLSPGIYHYRLLAETAGKRFEQTRKMVVVR